MFEFNPEAKKMVYDAIRQMAEVAMEDPSAKQRYVKLLNNEMKKLIHSEADKIRANIEAAEKFVTTDTAALDYADLEKLRMLASMFVFAAKLRVKP